MSEPLYTLEDGTPISTHSMIKAFRRCPKQAEYKYARRLKPKLVSLPLKRGNWLHSMLEAYGKAKLDGASEEDAQQAAWDVHKSLSYQFSELFDEEKEEYGDLPGETRRIFSSYLWHYQQDDWVVHDVEFTLETTFPDGTVYRCRIDQLIEDEFGLWLVDHKSHKTLPGRDWRIIESQSALYLWAALKNDIPVQGFIFNYLRTKAPTVPELIKSGTRISRWNTIDTDYPTAEAALKKYGFWTTQKIKPYKQKLMRLKRQQYRHGEPQTSSFFQRAVVEKQPAMLKRIAMEAYHTSNRMHEYFPPPHPDAVERVTDRSCLYMCSYRDLCTAELIGGNTQALRKNYEVGDPLDYYNDDKLEDLHHGD